MNVFHLINSLLLTTHGSCSLLEASGGVISGERKSLQVIWSQIQLTRGSEIRSAIPCFHSFTDFDWILWKEKYDLDYNVRGRTHQA